LSNFCTYSWPDFSGPSGTNPDQRQPQRRPEETPGTGQDKQEKPPETESGDTTAVGTRNCQAPFLHLAALWLVKKSFGLLWGWVKTAKSLCFLKALHINVLAALVWMHLQQQTPVDPQQVLVVRISVYSGGRVACSTQGKDDRDESMHCQQVW